MSYFESTLDIDHEGDAYDIFFSLEEEPLDEVNKFTNLDAMDPGPAGRCVAE